jgi:hypothetical protein
LGAFLRRVAGGRAANPLNPRQHRGIPVRRAPQQHPVTPATTADDVIHGGERELWMIEMTVLHDVTECTPV